MYEDRVSSFMLRFVTGLGNVFTEKGCLNNSSCLDARRETEPHLVIRWYFG